MNALDSALDHELDRMAHLKRDLVGVEELLEERPVNHQNIAGSVE